MTQKHDQLQDLAEIHSMMERSSKFLSLSGFSAIVAGLYALAGAYIAYAVFRFVPKTLIPTEIQTANWYGDTGKVSLLAVGVLILSLSTAFFLSARKAQHRRERAWNASSRRLLIHMGVPLLAGGILILLFLSKGLVGLLIPSTLIFYGLALFSASKFTYDEVRSLGLIQVILGLLSFAFIPFSLVLWVFGFGLMHIVYGFYIHFTY